MRSILRAIFALALVMPTVGVGTSAGASDTYQGCGQGAYRDSEGHCVRRPVRTRTVPSGASARCRDGTYSFSHSRRGTCSHHGGVAVWL